MRKVCSFVFLILLVAAFFSLSAVKPSPVSAQSCGGPVPPAPKNVWAKSGPNPGEVTLYWDGAAHANRYAVAYGVESGKYMYGADNIGGASSAWYTVKSLRPGVKYYFRLAAARDRCSSPFSSEVWAVSTGGQVSTPSSTPTSVDQPLPATSSSSPVGKQMLWAKSGPNVGEVTLYWNHVDSANNYHLVYGTEHGKFKYGALNIGKINSFTVRSLVPGKLYHFALVPLVGNRPLYTTDQVMMQAQAPQVQQSESFDDGTSLLRNPNDENEAPVLGDTSPQPDQELEQEIIYEDGEDDEAATGEDYINDDVQGFYQEDGQGF